MQHNVYSIGVLLLETGLWTSFILPRLGHEILNLEAEPALAEKLQNKNQSDRAVTIKEAFQIMFQLEDLYI